MPSLTATATTTHELQLKPAVKKRLLTELRTYADLAVQRKAIDEKMAGCRGVVEEIQTELEETSVELEGFKSTIVAPMCTTFDKKKFVRLGGDLAIYENVSGERTTQATVRVSVKLRIGKTGKLGVR